MRHRLPISLIALAAAVLVLAGAGCGGATGTAGGTDLTAAARAFPAHPLAFVDVNLDRNSAAWQQAEAVGRHFPGWSTLVTKFQAQLEHSSGSGHSFSKDVQPWLGNQAAIAVTSVNIFDSRHPVNVAGYVAVRDEGALRSELASAHATSAGSYHGFALFKHGSEVAAVGKSSLLVANNLTTLHQQIAALDGGPSLATQPGFTKAMQALPPNSLIKAYADGVKLGQIISLAAMAPQTGVPAGSRAQVQKALMGLRSLGSLTASFGADHGGLRLAFNATPAPGHRLPEQLTGTGDAAQTLLANVPANAFAYLGGGASSRALTASSPQLSKMLQVATGLSWKHDVAPLLTGRVAAYAGPGLPVTAAVMLKPADPAAAASAMSRITAAIARKDPQLHFHWLPGHRGQVATVRPGLVVGWHRVGDVIAISNDAHAGAAQTSPLTTNELFQTVAHQAGLPQQVSSLGYFSVPGLVSSLPIGGASGNQIVDHLGALLLWSNVDGSGAHFTAFLSVR